EHFASREEVDSFYKLPTFLHLFPAHKAKYF
ncbi:unnamed protein product, partial [marine sediment metagenome]